MKGKRKANPPKTKKKENTRAQKEISTKTFNSARLYCHCLSLSLSIYSLVFCFLFLFVLACRSSRSTPSFFIHFSFSFVFFCVQQAFHRHRSASYLLAGKWILHAHWATTTLSKVPRCTWSCGWFVAVAHACTPAAAPGKGLRDEYPQCYRC